MAEVEVSEDVQNLIGEIIVQNNWELVAGVKYYALKDGGDGHPSMRVGIEIPAKTGTVRLFAKYCLWIVQSENFPMDKLYGNETYFYEKIYRAFEKFSQDKGVKGAFDNAPKCYGTSQKFTTVLENLRDRGFRRYECTISMDEPHIVLVLKTFAKFHAISFVMKDQDRETYNRLLNEWDGDFHKARKKDALFQKTMRNMITEGVEKFNRDEDKRLRERCNVDELFESIMEAVRRDDEYSVFTHGNCWCDTMMFLYEGKTYTNPIDIKLLDWKLLRPTSTVYDLSYFLFSVASPEDLKRHHYYLLGIYYKELCDQIKRFGSDPEILYPKSVFLDEWKKYCKYGFALVFILFKCMLAKKEDEPNMEDQPNMEDFSPDGSKDIEVFSTYPNEDVRRIRIVGEFMVDNDYI